MNICFISKIESINVDDAFSEESWAMTIYDELNQCTQELMSIEE